MQNKRQSSHSTEGITKTLLLFEPMLPGTLQLYLPTKSQVCIDLPKQTVYEWSYLANLNPVFEFQVLDFHFLIAQV